MWHVALIYDAKLPYDVKVMSGVAQYMQEGAEFIPYTEEDALKNQKLPDLRRWKGNGILANFDDPKVAEAVLRAGLPTIGFGSGFGWYSAGYGIPYFFSDQKKIGEMAADHLMEHGLRNFAYCDYARSPTNAWSDDRQKYFARRLARFGYSCPVFRPRHKTTRQWSAVLAALGEWLRALPKPVGVMGANDRRAHHVLEACRSYEIRVPEEVAVLGVDNDEMLCQLSNPALSSIEQGARQIGYRAAALLDRMMRGARRVPMRHVVAPIEVVTRRSTDVYAVEDEVASGAMNFILAHAHRGIDVSDVVTAIGMSRSTLETRFRNAIGRTVHEAIRHAQMEQVRRLVLTSTLGLKEIAANSGFHSVQHMTTLFTQRYGMPPATYRKSIAR